MILFALFSTSEMSCDGCNQSCWNMCDCGGLDSRANTLIIVFWYVCKEGESYFFGNHLPLDKLLS